MRGLYILLTIFIGVQSYSQLNFGEYNTPYSGVHGLRYNPAEIVDSRYKFHLSLLNISTSLSNNYISVSNELLSMSPPSITDNNRDSFLFENLNGKSKAAYSQTNISMMNFMLALGEKSSIGLSYGLNLLMTANNVNEKLARYAYDNKNPLTWGASSSKDISLNGTAWGYLGLTYGRVLMDKNKNFLKVAVTGKVNLGLANTYMTSEDMYVDVLNENTIKKANGRLLQQFSANLYGGDKFENPGVKFDNLGFGADVGVIYEKRDSKDYTYEFDCKKDNVRKDLNKYQYRVGASLIDFGFVGFSPSVNLRGVYVDSARFVNPLSTKVFNKAQDADKYIDSLTKYGLNGILLDTVLDDYQMWTPTTFNVFFDMHIWKGFYAAANGTIGFVNHNLAGSKVQNSQFNFVPRFDSKLLGIYLPVNYNMLAEEVNVGLGLRLFFMNIAIQDWTAIAGLKKATKNAGVNFSLNIPFHQRKHPRDADHDLMSNKIDDCKKLAGDCNTGGCPDPDDDGDGVPNSMDKCPSHIGLPEFDGCPDTDKDGIPDKDDVCPKVKGVKGLGGCPDTDGDGITDKDDKCPKEAGPKEYEGCPDTDGDKIPNNLDECPFEPGGFENKGCPEVKPDVDTDKDGLIDTEDKCPTEFGPKSNEGCPISKEGQTIIKFAKENLEFHTGSDVIKKESYAGLEVLAQYLTKNKNYKVELSGHTDDVGDADKNMRLSQSRAASVMNYFISKGIASDRLSGQGYGEAQPIGDNNTVSGRAINRRVEIDIK